ncbi:MAG: SDR family NAD(P)-dependent oxidoreductase [Acholeplasmataceae bacterium]
MSQKIILVVGASSGFGFEISKKLLSQGHVVYTAARSLDRMKPLKDLGASVKFMDVTDQKTIQACIDEIIQTHHRIDIVYNNAGYGQYGPVDINNLSHIKDMYDVNLFGAAMVNHAVLPFMRRQKSGRIIITGSLVSNLSIPGIGWYASTKHALRAMTEALRIEVKPYGIKVIQIEPGAVKTGFESIAVPSIKEHSYDKDYAEMMNAFENYITGAYQKAPSAKSTIKAMEKAGFSRHPKWVYRTTFDAKILPIIKVIFGLKISALVIEKQILKQRSTPKP